jgi:hypothetical protein
LSAAQRWYSRGADFNANFQGARMAGPTSDYHRGEMDIHEQQATFQMVMAMTKWGSLTVAVGLLFAVLWFCTTTGFLGAFAAALALAVIGGAGLKSKAPAH